MCPSGALKCAAFVPGNHHSKSFRGTLRKTNHQHANVPVTDCNSKADPVRREFVAMSKPVRYSQ